MRHSELVFIEWNLNGQHRTNEAINPHITDPEKKTTNGYKSLGLSLTLTVALRE
jgi:hypothetical protein